MQIREIAAAVANDPPSNGHYQEHSNGVGKKVRAHSSQHGKAVKVLAWSKSAALPSSSLSAVVMSLKQDLMCLLLRGLPSFLSLVQAHCSSPVSGLELEGISKGCHGVAPFFLIQR